MTQSMDSELKTSQHGLQPQQMPSELVAELALMRRRPTDFVLDSRSICYLTCDRKKGAKSAYTISCGDELAGAWCARCGWLWFNTASFPPTERLKPSEVRDRQLSAARKRGPRRMP